MQNKIITAAAGLEEGIVNSDNASDFYCSGAELLHQFGVGQGLSADSADRGIPDPGQAAPRPLRIKHTVNMKSQAAYLQPGFFDSQSQCCP